MAAKILVVDDNEDIRYSLKEGLEALDKGYQVETAETGEKCLEILPKVKPDIIFMDIMMPGIDGFDTSLKIKEIPEFKDTPIIFLSAKTDTMSKGTADVIGEIFLEKPCEIEDLEKAISKVLK